MTEGELLAIRENFFKLSGNSLEFVNAGKLFQHIKTQAKRIKDLESEALHANRIRQP